MSEQPTIYRGIVDAKINGVACQVKLCIEPLANNELAGVVGLPDHHDEPLVGFVANASKIAFLDLPSDDDAALGAAFGTTAVDVRGCLCRLAIEILLPDAREIMLPASMQQPAAPTAHTLH